MFLIALFTGNSVQAQDEYLPIIKKYLSENLNGFSASDVSELEITNSYYSKNTETQHVYVNQNHNDVKIFNAQGNFAIKNNKVVYFSNSFQNKINTKTNNSSPSLDPITAVQKLASKLNLSPSNFEIINSNGKEFLLSNGGISQKEIPVKLMYQTVGESIKLAWNININTLDDKHWWDISIDASNGEILFKNDWVLSCNFDNKEHTHTKFEKLDHPIQNSNNQFGFFNITTLVDNSDYNVFPIPIESPIDGVRQIVKQPANLNASPNGWHDNNGSPGVEFTITRGNNVFAFENRGDGPGSFPDGGDLLNFDFPLNLNQDPEGYIDASVTNLFYLNNMMHDVWYEYGFNEASGNFQNRNYSSEGNEFDFVLARAQDDADAGPGNNATFSTPPDGQNPTMRMFTWQTSAGFEKDGSLDSGIVAHEYGHGISNRLTGGPANASCLYACQVFGNDGDCDQYTEQMGEGWSDFFALIMTLKPGDTADDPKTIANYALSQNQNGSGLRPAPYSRDTSINPATYGTTNNGNISAPHGVGFVWATMLWDITWDLIDEYGYDNDLLNGTGGNNIAMQLVMDGLKLQTCNPGFVDGRDAILQADILNNGGANQCLIWQAFADRGLGYSADQGSSLDRFDQIQAFDMPPLNVLDCSLNANSFLNEKEFSIYPNPASGYVNIKASSVQNDVTVAIYDLNGRMVVNQFLQNTHNAQININSLAIGVYVVKINSNGNSQTEKLIIQ
ncbi:M36 family metallopeptidase [Mesonia algae]|nr:M36 family metallopeptidase [Mesonia algae]